MLRVVMRGEVIDGRGLVKASMGGAPRDQKPHGIADIDLDIKIGAVAGFNGEALRALDLRVVRRAGVVRSFATERKARRRFDVASATCAAATATAAASR